MTMLLQQSILFLVRALLPTLPLLLACLAGTIVALILATRHPGAPAILAMIGFGTLFILYLTGLCATFAFSSMLPTIWMQQDLRGYMETIPSMIIATTALNCCCNVTGAAALVCLVISLWQAFTGRSNAEATPIG